jgi:hypothetical protein
MAYADWTDQEVKLIVANYFAMLKDELLNKPINKTYHRNALAPLLNNRSKGSIEFKHQNISSALIKQGLPFIKGYKPLANYQKIIDEKIIDYLKTEQENLISKFEYFAQNVFEPEDRKLDFANILTQPPELNVVQDPGISYKKRPIKINYIEQEQKNSVLGLKGEEIVIKYEKWRLITGGQGKYADKIEWISKNDDGAGFDILSKNKNGTDRYIEVKTTKLSKETPFYFSKNEYDFSKEKRKDYHLYRLFNFSDIPKLFLLNGDYDSFCKKEAIQYKGFF